MLNFVAGFVAIIALASVLGFGLYAYGHQGRIYQGVSVGGVDLSGMTRTEAVAALQSGYTTYMNTPLTLSYKGEMYAISPNQLDLKLDAEQSVDAAMQYGRGGSIWHRSQQWARGLFGGTDLGSAVVSGGSQTDAALLALTPNIARAPANA